MKSPCLFPFLSGDGTPLSSSCFQVLGYNRLALDMDVLHLHLLFAAGFQLLSFSSAAIPLRYESIMRAAVLSNLVTSGNG